MTAVHPRSPPTLPERMYDPVERVELAPGFTISRVLTGLWQIADLERDGRALDPDRTADAMLPYVERGLTTFDMADHYGSAEVIAGRFRARAPERPVELLTKWVPRPGPLEKADVREAVERALRRLGTERLDLLQFHAWSYPDPAWLDGLFWLAELRDEGLIAHLGLTNFDTAHLRMVIESGIDVVSNQVCLSLVDRRPLRGMTELCVRSGVHLLAYGTVAGGFLTERWIGAVEPTVEQLPTWSQMKYKRFIDAAGGWASFQKLLGVLGQIAERKGVSVANVACRYVLDQPGVGGVVIGARLGASDHIDDNLRLAELRLDPADVATLERAADGLEVPGESGDEYRRPPFLTAAGDLSHHLDSLPPPYRSRPGPGGRSVVLTGTSWETVGGYSRAVRQGSRVLVSGTTATHRDRVVGGADPASQTHFVIDKVEGALMSLGARLEDVVRTRLYVRNAGDWEPVARAHGARFGNVLPANTLVQAGLVGDEYLVEMEAEAVLGDRAEGANNGSGEARGGPLVADPS